MKSEINFVYQEKRSLALFILIITINSISCDIPVHCLKSQITGEWTYYLTKAYPQTKDNLYKLGCSHTIPSNENNAYKARIDEKYFVNKLTVKLNEDDSAEVSPYRNSDEFFNNQYSEFKLIGTWTMVYDEGFDVNVQDYSFFSFSKYAPNPNKTEYFSGNKKSKWVSMCYSTLIGWYHKGNSWGCFFAHKNNESSETITNGEVMNKMIVVENTVKRKDDSGFNFMRFKQNKKYENDQKYLDKSKFEQEISSDKDYLKKTATMINSVQSLWIAEPYDEFTSMTLKELNKYAGRRKAIIEKSSAMFVDEKDESNIKGFDHITENLKFLKKIKEKMQNHKNNNKSQTNNSTKSYSSNNYLKINNEQTKDNNKNINILNNTNSFEKIANEYKFKSISNAKKHQKKKKLNSYSSSLTEFENNYQDLPRNFNRWTKYMPQVRNQGKCGSCYAVSTLNMLESRLKIKYGISEELSLNHILNCSVYNQGCEGGYSYLVLKFAKKLELIPKACENNEFRIYENNKYDSSEEYQCSANKCANNPDIKYKSYKVSNFGYLGGSYGKCSEELLMRELIENGPVVVSFEPDYHFMMYRKGIYKSIQTNWMTKNMPKPEWEKVDHSVTLVGWGFDELHQTKYWLLLNSWGKHWGEKGYFRMVRGEDHLGIESICEIGNIYPVRD